MPNWQYPCSVCAKCVRKNQKYLECTSCKKRTHLKCTHLSNSNSRFLCKSCSTFSSSTSSTSFRNSNLDYNRKTSCLSLKNFVHCGILSCPDNCNENSERIFCVVCFKWFHYKCKKLSKKAYKTIIDNKLPFVCEGICNRSLFPFSNLNDIEFLHTQLGRGTFPCKVCKMDCLGKELMDCIQCDICDHWFHESCAPLEYLLDYYDSIHNLFICSNKCYLTLQPFYQIRDNCLAEILNSDPCKICREECLGYGLENSIECDVCHYWIHADCLNLTDYQFYKLSRKKEKSKPFICSDRCKMCLFPFHSINLLLFNKCVTQCMWISKSIMMT